MSSEQKVIELLLKQSEGVKLKSFEDSDGLMCIGINLVKYYPHGALIRENDRCMEKEAHDWAHKKLHRDVYPDIYNFCRKHNVPKEVYESLCVFEYNEKINVVKQIPFIVCLVNSRWRDLSVLMYGYHFVKKDDSSQFSNQLFFSNNKLKKRIIEIDNFKHLFSKIEEKYD